MVTNNSNEKDILKKIHNNSGESIAETLVALLISALALVMLAGAVTAGSRIVRSSKDRLDTYYNNNETVVKMGSGGSDGKITFKHGDKVIGSSVDVLYYENGTFTSDPVVSYRKK